jgi:hypothetical protein
MLCSPLLVILLVLHSLLIVFYWLHLYLSKILLQLLFLDCQLFFGLTSNLITNADSLHTRTKDMNLRSVSCNVSIIWYFDKCIRKCGPQGIHLELCSLPVG